MKGEEMDRYDRADPHQFLCVSCDREQTGYVCSDCGALVFDTEAHDRWHDHPPTFVGGVPQMGTGDAPSWDAGRNTGDAAHPVKP